MLTTRKTITFISATTVIGLLGLFFTVQGDRASLSVEKIEFEPFPLVAGRRARVAVTFKNSGKNYGTLESASIDRIDTLPVDLIYEPAHIAPAHVAGSGGIIRLISDLGASSWLPTIAEAESINKGHAPFRILGFVEYSDRYWFFPRTAIGFCYAWDSDAGGNFSACSEGKFTYTKTLWPFQKTKVRDIPTVETGLRAISPTHPPMRFPDPRFPTRTIETR